MTVTFDRTGTAVHEIGKHGEINYVRVPFYKQYYGEIECSECGTDLVVGQFVRDVWKET